MTGRIFSLLLACIMLIATGGVLQSTADTEANKALIVSFLDALSGKEKPAELLNQYISDSDQHLKDSLALYEEAFPLYEMPILDIMAEEDKVAVRTTFRGTHQGDLMGIPPTGVEVKIMINAIYRIADGMIVEHWLQADTLGLMQQLGAVDPAGREEYDWSEPSEVTGDPGDPETNKAIVVRFLDETWNQQNPAAADEFISPDIVEHLATGGISVGIEAHKQTMSAYIATYPDIHIAIDDMAAEGDKVAKRWTCTGTHQGELMGIPPTGREVTFPGITIYRFADGKIVELWWAWDVMGMMQQLTAVPEKDYGNVFFMSLDQGLNMISVPLEPFTPLTARSLAKEIGATVVIKYDKSLGRFKGFTPAAPDDGFPVEGGEGYIVNVPEVKTVAFHGAAWTNEPAASAAPPAQTSSAWAFVVSGSVLDGDGMSASDGEYTVTVKNPRTGEILTEAVDTNGYFASASADLSRKTIISAGDQVEVTVMDSSGRIVSGPFIHDIKLDEIRNAVVNLHLKLGEIIPAKPALLQNYPNPFNPETWIPYHLSATSPVVIRIHNASGQLVRTLDLGYRDAGIYASRSRAAYWDGRNEAGEAVASGIYFYRITAGGFSAIRKMIVTK